MKTRSNITSTTATKHTIPGSKPLRAKAKPKVTASTVSKRKPTSSGSTGTLTTAEAWLLHELEKKKWSTMVVQELAEKTGKTLTPKSLRHHVNIPTESRKRAATLLAEEVNESDDVKDSEAEEDIVSRKRQKTNSPVISEEDTNDMIDILQGNQDSDYILPRNLEEEEEELVQQGQDIDEDQERPNADEQDGVD